MARILKNKLLMPHLWMPLLICVAAGCGKSGPEVAPVKGRVTLDGRPLSTVDIVFQPEDGKPPATSRTDEEGHYELLYKRGVNGAPVGQHTVRIAFTSGIVAKPPTIPDRYNKQSELHREVKSGSNEIDFDLKSEGK
jgi:hypothetical protein